MLLPMASSPDGLISARYEVITKTPGWEVLTTTSNVNVTQGHGWVGGGGVSDLLSGPFAVSSAGKPHNSYNHQCFGKEVEWSPPVVC